MLVLFGAVRRAVLERPGLRSEAVLGGARGEWWRAARRKRKRGSLLGVLQKKGTGRAHGAVGRVAKHAPSSFFGITCHF